MYNTIELKDVCKKYDNFALNHVSFQVPVGSIVGFVGENGAGKTTTIKAILNLIRVDSGSIRMFGLDHLENEQDIKEQVGVVFDECCFHEHLSAGDLNRIMCEMYKNWQQEEYFQLLAKFHLDKNKMIKEYSRGMRMKLSIAVAMSHQAKLLIMDEATSGLDPVVRDKILDLFMEFIQDEEHTILVSSHIISDLEKIADYIVFIHQGRILFDMNKDELLEKYGIVRCRAEDLNRLDRNHVIGVRKNSFGCEALVDNRPWMEKNARNLVVEKTTIEEVLLFYVKGEKI